MHALLFESNDLSHCSTMVGRLPADTRLHFPLRSIVLRFQLVNVHQIKKHSNFQPFFPHLYVEEDFDLEWIRTGASCM